MYRCAKCDKYLVLDAGCPCRRWSVAVREWDTEYDWKDGQRVPDSAQLNFSDVYALTAEEAAEQYVSWRDAETCDRNTDDVLVAVRDPANADVEITYRVATDIVREYWVTLAEPPKENEQ